MSKDEEYLGVGMADALITYLSNVKGMVVRPTSAVRHYTGAPHDVLASGHALRVDAIIEATMQRARDRVRVTVQLVDVRTSAPIWAERFEEAFTDLFALQDAIAQRVATSLVPQLSRAERRRLQVRRTASLDAYHAYLRGRYHWTKRDGEGLQRAMRWFRQAIDLDPTYALAYVGLADCFVILRSLGWPAAPDAAAVANAAVSRALDIDDSLGEAHATRGMLRMFWDWDWQGAETSFQRAIELAPNYAVVRNWYANYLAAVGRFDDSIRQARHAVVLDPMSTIWCAGVGNMLLLARRYEEAVRQAQSALDMEPRFVIAHWVLGMAYEQLGDVTRAVEAFRYADECSGSNLLSRGLLGRILAVSGRDDEARGMLADLTSRDAAKSAPPEAVALIHAGLGDTEAAFDWLEGAAHAGAFFLTYLNVSPLFDSLRSEPRFGALQRLVRLA
jgi:TolB-like protein/Flp pilus assembly protein TadD